MNPIIRRLLRSLANRSRTTEWACKIWTRKSPLYRAEVAGRQPVGMCPPCGDTPWGRAILAGVEVVLPTARPRRRNTLGLR